MKPATVSIFRRILSGIAVVLVAAPAYAAPILNAGFETPVVTGSFDTYTTITTPASFEWTVGGTIDHIGSLWVAAEGDQSVDLSGFTAGSVAQAVSLDPGDYVLRFAMAGNPDGGDPVKDMAVAIAGGGIAAGFFSFDTTGKTFADMGWVYHTLPFTVLLALPTVFTFTSLELLDCCWGPALDDISITQVGIPEPSTILLLSGGVAALLARRRVRARR